MTAAAAASEEERAKAERQIERVEAQMEGLKCVVSMLRADSLWNVEKACEAWERERSVWVRERSVGCVLCHPLLLEARARAAARAGSRVLTAGSTG